MSLTDFNTYQKLINGDFNQDYLRVINKILSNSKGAFYERFNVEMGLEGDDFLKNVFTIKLTSIPVKEEALVIKLRSTDLIEVIYYNLDKNKGQKCIYSMEFILDEVHIVIDSIKKLRDV